MVMCSRLYFLLCIGAASLVLSCTPRSPKEDTDVVLQVNLSNSMGLSTVYLQELGIRDIRNLDSFDVRKTGRYTFRFSPGQSGLYLVQTKPNQFITLLLEPGERVELLADGKKMQKDYQVKGSAGSVLLQDYFRFTQASLHRVDSLKQAFKEASQQENYAWKRLQLDSLYRRIYDNQKAFVTRFLHTHCGSIAALFVINQRFGPAPLFTEKDDFTLFKALDSCLMQRYPNNTHVLDHHERVVRYLRAEAEKKLAMERLATGKPAPVFSVTDLHDQPLRSDQWTGKVVLLYFWTATTAVARQDHFSILPYYKKMGSKGLKVLGVSFDPQKGMAEAAISIDRLPWTMAWEANGITSPLARLFAVESPLPVFYVIDREGNIAGRFSRFDDARSVLDKCLLRASR